MKILVLEPEPVVQELYESLLKVLLGQDILLEFVVNLAEALKKIAGKQEQDLNLIIADVLLLSPHEPGTYTLAMLLPLDELKDHIGLLPKQDPVATFVQIRQASNAPVVVCTTITDGLIAQRCVAAGANGYVTKPFDYQTFKSVLLQAIS